MSRPRLLLVACLLISSMASAQTYPERPITIINGFGAGGGADLFIRSIVPEVSEALGQPVLVDYRVGAGGNIAMAYVARAALDGYVLLLGTPGLITNPLIFADVKFDSLRDFAPVSLIGSTQNVLIVDPALPINSVKDLIALAKAKPGQLNFSSSGVGSSLHLAGEFFKLAAGIDVVHVAYKGGVQAQADVVSGQAQMMFNVLPSALPLIKGGQLKALAVTGTTRSDTLPDTPTMIEAGLPGYVALTWNGVLAPANTPKPIVDKLSAAFRRALGNTDVRKRLTAMGQDGLGTTPRGIRRLSAGRAGQMDAGDPGRRHPAPVTPHQMNREERAA
ncbi:MAG: tripartite tricarboxylate transporter substrate binding protein [Pseudomonadota bacterium]